ncbi:hypothetical protein DFH06DRAFT_1470600 [Mycena polygramma]|nr:hypothetical protein DFH06DRAFT_1470600 [Mycena polygramma]
MSGSTESAVEADPPFSGHTEDGDAPADIIFRTTVDGAVDFHVHKGPLSFVSEVFRDMFEMADENPHLNETKDGKPIVPVFDSSPALEILLRLCYPFAGNFQPRTLHGVEGAIVAAEKYQIKPAVAALRAVLTHFVATEPYWVFGIALRRKATQVIPENIAAMGVIVDAAALETLKKPFLPRSRDITAVSSTAFLVQLHDFHTTCGNGAAEFAAHYTRGLGYHHLSGPPGDRSILAAVWWSGEWNAHAELGDNRDHHDECGGSVVEDDDPDFPFYLPTLVYPPSWFIEHMTQVSEALKISPTEQQIRAKLFDKRTMYQLDKCAKCAGKALADLEEFVLKDLIADVVAHNLAVVQTTNFHL